MTKPTIYSHPLINLDGLKDEAKSLQKAVKQNDVEAINRVRPYFDSEPTKLTQMQLVIAREFGFDSWTKLTEALKQRDRIRERREEISLVIRRYQGQLKKPGRDDEADRLALRAHILILDKKENKRWTQHVLYCSFCGNSRYEVRKLIAGPAFIFICDQCVERCNDIQSNENADEWPGVKDHQQMQREVAQVLRQYQDQAPPGNHCSFCGNERHEVESLIAAPGELYVCNECLVLCNEIRDDRV